MTLDGHGGCLSWLRYSMGPSRGAGGSFGRGLLGGEQLLMGVCGPIWLYWPSAVCKGRVGGGIGQNNAPAILKRCAAYVPCRGCSPGMAGPWWHGAALYPWVTSSYMGILVAGGPFQSGRMEGHQAILGPSLCETRLCGHSLPWQKLHPARGVKCRGRAVAILSVS